MKKLMVLDYSGDFLDSSLFLVDNNGQLCRLESTMGETIIVSVNKREGISYYWEEYPLLKRYEECTDEDEKGETHYFTKFKIVVSSEEDKQQLEEAFRYIHDQNIDTDYVTVNQLVHMYLERDNKRIEVDPSQFT